MSDFDYHPAGSVQEALALLERYGEDSQLLAGGTSVLLLHRLGMLGAEHVIGIRGLPELEGVSSEAGGDLRIGALTTLTDVVASPQVQRAQPELAAAVRQVATVRIRNQATLGGNLAHADPAQDPPAMLLALDAQVEATGPEGSRRLPVEGLFAGYLQTTLRHPEILTAIVVPPAPPGIRAGYLKFLPRTVDDYATVSVAAAVRVVEGRWDTVRIGLGALGPTPRRARTVESVLLGQPVGPAVIKEAAASVGADIEPVSDARGTSAYKRQMAAVCLGRLLQHLAGQEESR